jgi:hypothetical protein
VDDHDVTRAHALGERGHGVSQYLLVDGAGGAVERSTVSDSAVQPVVDALVTAKKSGVPSITTQRTSTPAPRA